MNKHFLKKLSTVCLLLTFTLHALGSENIVSGYAGSATNNSEGILASHVVDLNIDAIYAADVGGINHAFSQLSSDIDFTLPDGSTLRFERAFDQINYQDNSYTHWSGTLFGASYGIASLTVAKALQRGEVDQLYGEIYLDDAAYIIEVDQQGQQVLHMMDPSFSFDCGTEVGSVGNKKNTFDLLSTELNQITDTRGGTTAEDEEVIIDVGVVFRLAPNESRRRFTDTLNGVFSAINAVLTSSGSNVQFNLKAIQGMSFGIRQAITNNVDHNINMCEDTLVCAFDDLHNNMTVREFRSSNELDLVSFFVLGDLPSDLGGFAELPNSVNSRCNNGFNVDCAFTVIDRMNGNWRISLAHELGHNLGLFHETDEGSVVPGARGYVIPGNPVKPTLMVGGRLMCLQEGSCPRKVAYSNPNPPPLEGSNTPVPPTGLVGTNDSVNGLRIAGPMVAQYGNQPIPIENFGLSGAWEVEGGPRQGLTIEINPNQINDENGFIFASWFTFINGPDGNQNRASDQRWYSLSSNAPLSGTQAELDIFQNTGGRFDSATAVDTQLVGTATLSFTSCTRGRLDFEFFDGVNADANGVLELNRASVAGPGCDGAAGNHVGSGGLDDFGLTGTWADLDALGQGMVVELNSIQNILFAGWFTYSNVSGGENQQRWYTIQGGFLNNTNSTTLTAPIRRFTGGRFNQADSVQDEVVGSATIEFLSCTEANLSYGFNDGREGEINLTRLLPNVNCGH